MSSILIIPSNLTKATKYLNNSSTANQNAAKKISNINTALSCFGNKSSNVNSILTSLEHRCITQKNECASLSITLSNIISKYSNQESILANGSITTEIQASMIRGGNGHGGGGNHVQIDSYAHEVGGYGHGGGSGGGNHVQIDGYTHEVGGNGHGGDSGGGNHMQTESYTHGVGGYGHGGGGGGGSHGREDYINNQTAIENTLNYIDDTISQMICGNFTDDCTVVGTIGNIALGFTPIGWVFDARDITADIYHLIDDGPTNSEWLSFGVDLIGICPGLDALKYTDEIIPYVDEVLYGGKELVEQIPFNSADEIYSKLDELVDNTSNWIHNNQNTFSDILESPIDFAWDYWLEDIVSDFVDGEYTNDNSNSVNDEYTGDTYEEGAPPYIPEAARPEPVIHDEAITK